MGKRSVISLIFIAIVCFSFFVAYESGNVKRIARGNTIILAGEAFTPEMNAKNFETPGLVQNTYTVTIPKSSFEAIDQEAYTLMIYRLADNAHRVYLNDVLIGAAGDFKSGNSNLWNAYFAYHFNHNIIQPTNILKIETVASYRSGLSSVPIYITDLSASAVIAKLQFYGEQINALMIGFILFSSVVTLVFYLTSREKDQIYLYVSIATLMTASYYSSYLTYFNVGLPYLFYKKMVMTALFMGIAFYSFVFSRYYKIKWIKELGSLTIILAVLIALFADNMVDYKMWYTYSYLMITVNIIGWLYISFHSLKESQVSYILFTAFTILIFYSGITIFMDMMGSYFNFNSPMVYICIMATIPLMMVYNAIEEKERLLIEERTLKEQEVTKSLTDKLTETWNQRYMTALFAEPFQEGVIAMIDIDHFKRINDSYGHFAGDYILKEVADILKEHFRKSDVICRYGGDEFIVIMHNCYFSKGYETLENLRQFIEKYPFVYGGLPIAVTVSIGVLYSDANRRTTREAFKEADACLYDAKANGRNRIGYHNSI